MIINNLITQTSKTMKRLIFALSAVALMGLASACIEQMDPNPDFDPVKNTVTTQFVLNIAPADPQTKQSDAAVQQANNFRGLNNASLLTFSVMDGTTLKDGSMITTLNNESMRRATSYVDLSYALKPGSIDPWQTTSSTTPLSRRIVQIDLPTGTNTLVFYGEAVTGTSNDLTNDFGKLEYRKDGLAELDMTKIGCWASPRLPNGSDEANDYHRIEKIIESVYNNLFKVTHTFSNSTYGSYNMDGIVVTWKDYYDNAYDFVEKKSGYSPIPRLINQQRNLSDQLPDVQASPFEVILAKAYYAFQTVRTGELRAGSGKAVLRQMSDLYTVLYNGSQSDAMSALEDIARVYYSDITNYLSLFFEGVANNSRVLTEWKSIYGENGVVRALEKNRIDTLSAPSNNKYTLTAFPLHFDIPIGAATMTKDNQGWFKYTTHDIPLPVMGGGTMTVHDYTYPPSLVYFGNSPVRISNSNSLTDADFQDGASAWENAEGWNSSVWLNGAGTATGGFSHVTSNTRGVAMAYNIQYGNALLKATVKYADSVVNNAAVGLHDNNSGINGERDNVFHPSSTAGLQLTGVLVGGQPDTVGWNYLPTAGASFVRMVYDKRINSTTGTIDQQGGSTYALDIPTDATPSTPNFTTLFDNFDSKHLGGNPVYIALEFKNNLGDDFWGNANMVRNGGAFYLIAKVNVSDATAASLSALWGKKSKILPPYTDAGEQLTGNDYLRVFMQDYVTEICFTIGENALKSAFVTVPDLRSSSLSLGLSVDLNWQSGLSFPDVPLGKL